MCDQQPETMDHILIVCCYSREVWHLWLHKIICRCLSVTLVSPRYTGGCVQGSWSQNRFGVASILLCSWLVGCSGRNEMSEPSGLWLTRRLCWWAPCSRKLRFGLWPGTSKCKTSFPGCKLPLFDCLVCYLFLLQNICILYLLAVISRARRATCVLPGYKLQTSFCLMKYVLQRV